MTQPSQPLAERELEIRDDDFDIIKEAISTSNSIQAYWVGRDEKYLPYETLPVILDDCREAALMAGYTPNNGIRLHVTNASEDEDYEGSCEFDLEPEQAVALGEKLIFWGKLNHDHSPENIAKARELIGPEFHNAGAAAMREAAAKLCDEQARVAEDNINDNDDPKSQRSQMWASHSNEANDCAYAIRALPIPPDPADALRAENKRLSEALEFYANPLADGNGGQFHSSDPMQMAMGLLRDDAGKRARAALGAP